MTESCVDFLWLNNLNLDKNALTTLFPLEIQNGSANLMLPLYLHSFIFRILDETHFLDIQLITTK